MTCSNARGHRAGPSVRPKSHAHASVAVTNFRNHDVLMETQMSRGKYDRDLLASKIRWEGGVIAALDYGLHPDDIGDPELRSAWERLQQLHAEIRPLIRDFERRLRAPGSGS